MDARLKSGTKATKQASSGKGDSFRVRPFGSKIARQPKSEGGDLFAIYLQREADQGDALSRLPVFLESSPGQDREEPPAATSLPPLRDLSPRRVSFTGLTPLIQCDFPDAYNQERRQSQGIPTDSVQLDHMVSQKTLKSFADTYKRLVTLTSDPGSRWEAVKTALGELRDVVTKFPLQGHEFMSEDHLINIPQNIIPGLQNQIQGAGEEFDPQVAKVGTTGNVDRYEQTALSKAQLVMDSAMLKLNVLVGSATDVLPKKAAETKSSQIYDSDTDELIAEELGKITSAFTDLSQVAEANYDPDVWYDYQDSNVKKRPAEWIRDETQETVGGTPAPPRALWNYAFDFSTSTLGRDGGSVKKIPVTVNVNVDIPATTWAHIYDRHYLPTFGGTVEAVNTFWKQDPYVYLTGQEGQAILEAELRLALERSFKFSRAYDGIEEQDFDEDSWSQSADRLFFQANVDSTLTTKAIGGVEYDVNVELKSVAPQDPDLAYALLPDQLT